MGGALALPALTQAATAVTPPTAPPGVCPAVGVATDCGVVIVINPDGSISIVPGVTGNSNPYDSSPGSTNGDDTLIGLVNNASGPLSQITLSGSDIFGFESDGICSSSFSSTFTPASAGAYCSSLPSGSTSYEGPNNTFSVTDSDNGTVVFTKPVAGNGGTAFWSLEESITCNGDVPNCGISVPPGVLTVQKTDNTGKPLVGGTYALFSDASPHKNPAIGSCTITALDKSGNATCTDPSFSNLSAGQYYVDETNPPTGFTAAAETPVLVFGDTTATIVDTPIPPTAPASSTTTTTTAPVIPAATTVHTGEPFAGSARYVLGVAGAGLGLMGAGLLRRRRTQAARR
jgi:hypothetical protein